MIMMDKQINKAVMASNTSDSVSKYKFIEELDGALECVICLDVAEDPYQHVGHQCGRLLCKACLDKLGNKPCPNCRGEDPQYFEDHKSECLYLSTNCNDHACYSTQAREKSRLSMSNAAVWKGGVSGWELLVRWRNMWPHVGSL
jgi:hypothetical protein